MIVMSAPQLNPRLISLLAVCFSLVTVLVVLFLIRYPKFARQQVVEQLIFKNGSFQMQNFHSTEELKSLSVTFNLFNVTNANEVINNNAKIRVSEIGPFVYHEIKVKDFTQNDQVNGLITYKLRKRFIFDPDRSIADPKLVLITWPNVPMLAAEGALEKIPFFEREPARLGIEAAVVAFNEQPFITDTAENLLFKGSQRKIFEALQKLDLIKFFDPWPLKDNRFGLLYGKNDTWDYERDYLYTMSTGFGPNQTYENLNQFVYINGSKSLPFWFRDSPDCNELYGTDGEFFAPFMSSPAQLEVYSMDICRRLTFRFAGNAFIKGLDVQKYVLDGKSWQSSDKNKCYCLQRDTFGKLEPECSLDGLIDLSNCVAPNVVASGAHFFNGSKELRGRIDGLVPDRAELDEPYTYIEPNTGLSISVRVPMQMNVRLKRGGLRMFQFYQEDKSLIIPLALVTESAELDRNQAAQLRNKLLLLDSWLIGMILGGTTFFVLALFVIGCLSFTSYQSARSQQRQNKQQHLVASVNGKRRQCNNWIYNEQESIDDDDDEGNDSLKWTTKQKSQDRLSHETEPLIISATTANKTTMIKPPQYYQSL